jgi:hypothetical protein
VRYRAAVGVGEEAHSRQRHWCPWSKPVNVETWGHVPYPVVMANAFAELRYGIVARQHENGFKCGHISAQTLYGGDVGEMWRRYEGDIGSQSGLTAEERKCARSFVLLHPR